MMKTALAPATAVLFIFLAAGCSNGADDTANENPDVEYTPWDDDISHLLSYAQSADVLYLCAGDAIRPYRLERFGHSSWSILAPLFEDGPWLAANTVTTTTLTPSAGTRTTCVLSAESSRQHFNAPLLCM